MDKKTLLETMKNDKGLRHSKTFSVKGKLGYECVVPIAFNDEFIFIVPENSTIYTLDKFIEWCEKQKLEYIADRNLGGCQYRTNAFACLVRMFESGYESPNAWVDGH